MQSAADVVIPPNASPTTKAILFIALILMTLSGLSTALSWIPIQWFAYATSLSVTMIALGNLYHHYYDAVTTKQSGGK
jgi:hypothetical protein